VEGPPLPPVLPIPLPPDVLAALIQWPKPSIAVPAPWPKRLPATLVATLLPSRAKPHRRGSVGLFRLFRATRVVARGPAAGCRKADDPRWLVWSKVQGPKPWLITKPGAGIHNREPLTPTQALVETLTEFADAVALVLANSDCPVLRKNISSRAWWSIGKRLKGVDFAPP